jgi:hypothetical protein
MGLGQPAASRTNVRGEKLGSEYLAQILQIPFMFESLTVDLNLDRNHPDRLAPQGREHE